MNIYWFWQATLKRSKLFFCFPEHFFCRKHTFFHFTFFILLSTTAFLPAEAQFVAPSRIEINSRIDIPVYDTQIIGEKGLLMFYETNELAESGKRKWFFSLYDTAFQERWQKNVVISDGYILKDVKTLDNRAAFLFLAQSRSKRTDGFEVVLFNESDTSFRLFGSSLPEKTTYAGFALLKNAVFLGLNLPRHQTDILIYDFQNQELRSVGHGLSGQTVIQSVVANSLQNKFMVGIKRFESGKYKEDVFQVYSSTGQQLQSFSYPASPNFLHSYSLTFNEEGLLVAAGSYDDDWSRRNTAANLAEAEDWNFESKGLFYLAFDNEGLKHAQYHLFGTFTNIYQSLAADDLMIARKRQSRNARSEKRMDVFFRFFNPRLIQANGNIIFAGDAFKKQYHTETRMDYDFYGRLVPYTYTIFDGYNFFSSLFASFDPSGNLKWSSNLSLGETLLPYLKDISLAQIADDDFLTAYLKEGILSYKVLDINGKIIGHQEQVRIEPLFSNDRLLEDNFSSIVHWYGPYYLLTGYQKITNINLRADNVRRVFYMQKMIFE